MMSEFDPIGKYKNPGAPELRCPPHKPAKPDASLLSEDHRMRYLRIVSNFASEISKAGGCVEAFLDDAETMTVAQLLNTMALNNIEFKYTGKRNLRDE
jgi:hypothetical protein